MLGRSLLCLVVLLGAVSAWHLQSQPSVIERLCTPRIRSVCNQYGMRCRANQAFDADLPHAVCDQMNGRTSGIRPEVLLRRGGMRRSRQNFGSRFQTRGWSSQGGAGQWEAGMW